MRCTGCSEPIAEDAPIEVDDRGYFHRYHDPECRLRGFRATFVDLMDLKNHVTAEEFFARHEPL